MIRRVVAPRTFRSRLSAPSARTEGRDDRAAEHLQFIRETMARAGSFTAVSGSGQAIVGVIGLAAAWLASRQTETAAWLTVWLAAAFAGAGVAVVAIRAKAARIDVPLSSGPARRFALTFLPPLAAGAVLTGVLYRHGLASSLPGTWLLLFGTAVVTGGATSVGVVPVMGACFIVTALAAFALPADWGDLLMACGFGLLNILFGVRIAVKHGG
jgi:hypothetical protein